MPTCAEAFCESGFVGQGLQKFVDDLFPDFACEAERCSPFSPGPVQQNEDVAFLLIDPGHYDPNSRIVLPSAFQELINRDLSVMRPSHASKDEAVRTRDELIARGADKISPQLRGVSEVCIGRVENIRASIEEHGRILGVFDTSLEDKPAHASVFTVEGALTKKGLLRKAVRARIHAVMTERRESFCEFVERLA